MLGIFEFKPAFDDEHFSASPRALRCDRQPRRAASHNYEVCHDGRIVVKLGKLRDFHVPPFRSCRKR
ncbi:hypothetical protein N2599_25890 (plasmid) [Rhizobium sullae]|uniref:Uncharacterized protein n=1 Tax=Rhizobium sullae TaxID=50338 RepID=A0ABY5XWT9_RHISU|nr:hypothetical protein [Rhizobium sullae]UWU19083.1 hypothetical protein N2599_25890 [Rhizobium sullae]